MRPILLIQTGDAPEPIRARLGGFAEWFRTAMRLDRERLRVARVDEGDPLPAPDDIAGAVITGSAAMVTERADWSERSAAWIREALATGTPMFGVCYGHQLMAHALGGTVGWLEGREIGTHPMTRTASVADGKHPLLEDLPNAFPAHATHRQAVLVPPADAQVVVGSALDPHQLLAYGPLALSTQFHPEFTVEAMRAYIAARADALRTEGLDPDALTADVRETEVARALLERFARAALAGHRLAA